MAVWAKWEPDLMYLPCPDCPPSTGSVSWPASLAKRLDSNTEERRNDDPDCTHAITQPAHFRQTSKDDPRAEWVEIDWDPPVQ